MFGCYWNFNEQMMRVVLGALLHDIGKIIYRQGDMTQNHSISGYKYIKNEVGISDNEILECIRYHHANELVNAKIDDNSLAYIVYMADNIAYAADRREADDGVGGFDVMTPLQPVFNKLNNNSANKYYTPFILNEKVNIRMGLYYDGHRKKRSCPTVLL